MTKKIPRPMFLTKYVLRLRVFHVLIFLVVSAAIVFFSIRINNLGGFINNFLTTRTEWSLSEHNSLLSMLIAELNKNEAVKKESEDMSEKIKKVLREIKDDTDIEEIGVSENNEKKEYNEKQKKISINIDTHNYDEVRKYLGTSVLKKLTYKELNLARRDISVTDDDEDDPEIKRTYLESSDENVVPRSFVFIPTQLVNVNENGEPWLPIHLKREIVFSRIVEEHLLKFFYQNTIPEEDILKIKQVYFISLNGFIRLCPNVIKDKKVNPVKVYGNKLSYKKNFADRTYFDATIKKTFHQSSPYVSTGGFGIGRTYSISILNRNLGIVGIIAVDIDVETIKSLLEKLSLGSTLPWFKNFLIDFCKIEGEELKVPSGHYLKEEYKKQIIENVGNNLYKLTTEVCRFDFDTRGEISNSKTIYRDNSSISRIIYSVPIGKNEVAFIIFNRERILKNNLYFVLIIVTLLIFITQLIFFIYSQTMKRIKLEQTQLDLITHMGSSYIITDKDNYILYYNEEFENLVEDKKIIGESFEKYLSRDSLKDFNFYSNSGKEKFECPIDIDTGLGKNKPAILINTKAEYPFAKKKGSRISILIESENIESRVAEKYAETISHLLKSPLHSILGIADQLRRKTAKPRYDEYFRLLDYEIDTLRSKISRLLRISKIEIDKLKPEYEKFEISKLIKDIKKEFEPLIAKRKLEFKGSIAEGVTIWADRSMIKVAIEKILENALKYTIIGEISLSLFDAISEAKVEIKDTGIGIPKNEIDLIFKKKFRGSHPVVQRNEGQGIGLYQCKNFIELNHGKISVKSVVEERTEFTVILPKNLYKIKDK